MHKFFVFLNALNRPIAVWTGSYNFSMTSCNNEEDATLIKKPREVLEAYYLRWQTLKQGSESLDF
jgi:hypothetical protein